MTLFEEYHLDKDILLDKIKKEKLDTLDHLRSINNTTIEIKHYGYKTKEEAFSTILKQMDTKIEKLVVAFEKKYPEIPRE